MDRISTIRRVVPPDRPPLRLGRRDLLPLFSALWVLSLVRVALALARHEAFGTASTLAFIAVFLLPALLRGAQGPH